MTLLQFQQNVENHIAAFDPRFVYDIRFLVLEILRDEARIDEFQTIRIDPLCPRRYDVILYEIAEIPLVGQYSPVTFVVCVLRHRRLL
jgi:hypothetical protein